jgi:hypothetical protein
MEMTGMFEFYQKTRLFSTHSRSAVKRPAKFAHLQGPEGRREAGFFVFARPRERTGMTGAHFPDTRAGLL